MHLNDVRWRISHIKDVADVALLACRQDSAVPQALRESVAALDMDVNSALRTAYQTDDEARIVRCIDDLEASADRAKQILGRTYRIDEQTRNAVLRAHDEISRLKHLLH